MPSPKATLHLLCGKIAAGKSTLATKLGTLPNTVVLREDQWLAQLFPNEITSVAHYACYAERLRQAIEPHVIALLNNGLSVILDFPANTVDNRAWMRSLFEKANAQHMLYFVNTPDDACKERLRTRNTNQEHEYTVTDEQFEHISKYFVAPSADEGFNLLIC